MAITLLTSYEYNLVRIIIILGYDKVAELSIILCLQLQAAQGLLDEFSFQMDSDLCDTDMAEVQNPEHFRY